MTCSNFGPGPVNFRGSVANNQDVRLVPMKVEDRAQSSYVGMLQHVHEDEVSVSNGLHLGLDEATGLQATYAVNRYRNIYCHLTKVSYLGMMEQVKCGCYSCSRFLSLSRDFHAGSRGYAGLYTNPSMHSWGGLFITRRSAQVVLSCYREDLWFWYGSMRYTGLSFELESGLCPVTCTIV